ncbi:hypothetical protein ABPG72_018534 [Tetrahymena utriculariae]
MGACKFDQGLIQISGFLSDIYCNIIVKLVKRKQIEVKKIKPTLEQATQSIIQSQSIPNCMKTISQMFIRGLQPFVMVEDKGFINLIKFQDPRYLIPSQKYFSIEMIYKMQNDMNYLIQEEELQNQKFFVLTYEIWTSITTDSYLTLTSHFINDNFIRKKYILNFKYFEQSHTGEELYELIKSWSIQNKVVGIIHDSAPNMNCFAHMLHLNVQDSFKSNEKIQFVLQVICKIVKYCNKSTIEKSALFKIQKERNVKELNLKTDNVTRRSSVYYMIERFLELQEQYGICEKNSQLFLFWKQNSLIFPNLSALFKLHLSIPSSSADSERVCSDGSLLVSEKGSRLSQKKAEMLCYLKEFRRQQISHSVELKIQVPQSEQYQKLYSCWILDS